MGLNKQSYDKQTDNYFNITGDFADDLITIEECRKFTGNSNLDSRKIKLIRNYMIGIIDKTFNSYLENFK